MSNYPIVQSRHHSVARHSQATEISDAGRSPLTLHAVRPLLGQVTCLDYVHDTLAAAGDRVACIWNAHSCTLQSRIIAPARIAAISLSRDGRWFAVATGSQVQVHHQPTGELVFAYEHGAVVTSVHIASGASVVTSGDAQGQAQVRNVTDGAVQRVLQYPPGPLIVFLNHDASILVLETPDRNVLFDLIAGQPLRTFVNSDGPDREALVPLLCTKLVAFSGRILRFFDCTRHSAHAMRTHELGAAITSIDICNLTNTVLASTRAGLIHRFRLQSGDRDGSLHSFTIPLMAARFGPHKTIYAAGGEPLVMQLVDGHHVRSLLDEAVPIVAIAHSATHRALLVSDRDGGVTHYDLRTGRRSDVFAGHSGSVSAVVCDDRQVVSAAYDGVVRVRRWDGHLVTEFDPGHGPVQALALDSVSGTLWMGDWEGFSIGFDLRAHKAIAVLRERRSAIRSLNLDVQNQRLLIGDNDGGFTVRDLAKNNSRLGVWRQPGAVYRGVFDSDGSMLTTADDGVRRYVVGADDPLHIYEGETIRWFTLHGGRLYTLSLGGAIKVFDIAKRECIQQAQLDSPCPHRAIHVIGPNRILIGSGDGRVQVFNADLKPVATLQHLRRGVLWTAISGGAHPGWLYTDRPTLVDIGNLHDDEFQPWPEDDQRRATYLAVFNSAPHVMQVVMGTAT